ncbi:endonuclease [Christiangramia fulva]|uniref:Endonuclease n=1 Tax=Christiangramia fulva TaxID=2126553 RepID=A0A2R3Z9C2_9FLAO|nr:endonuclease/exonuclease/phosphatase family protein [Christiangramia fulva]AVR46875.1 endonuclease [Christiangramia fulva]
MNITEIFALIFSVLAFIPTLASITKFDQWWIRGFDFPRIQISFLIIVMILVDVWIFDFSETWHYVATIGLGLSLLYQFEKIFPYTYLASKQVVKFKGNDPDANISVLVSNVLTPNEHYGKLIGLIQEVEPDLILTLESDKKWEKELSVIEKDYPNTVKIPQDNLYGMHLYSRLKLEDIKVQNIVQKDIPSIHGYVILRNGKKIRLHCLHPMPPSPTESDTSTNRDAELLMLGRDINPVKRSTLVIGDLNDVAWSRTTRLFQKMSGLMDPRRGRGFFNTYNANYFLLRWPLDHMFHTKDFSLVKIKRERPIGSDHFPIFIKLHHQQNAGMANEDTDEADHEEKEWAQEKIDRANPLVQKIDFSS